MPSAIMVLDSLPLTPNGKLDRESLTLVYELTYSGAEYVEPRTDLERTLAEIWRLNLGVERIGIEDNYFAIGGDSIRSISLISESKSRGIEFSVRDLFSHPTIVSLAGEIAGGGVERSELLAVPQFSLLSEEEKIHY